MTGYPGYIDSSRNGRLKDLAAGLMECLKDCTVCPHHCHVNRQEGEPGFCRAGLQVEIGSYGPHFGGEPPLVGRGGSGTIFFSHCNLGCVFCQNYDISRGHHGEKVSLEKLARIMFSLQDRGCHNINLVTPSYYVPQIIAALAIAAEKGLRLPLVYNCGGYEEKSTLEQIAGLIDIYMPDFKYADPEVGKRLSHVPDYPWVAKEAIKEILFMLETSLTRRKSLVKAKVLAMFLRKSRYSWIILISQVGHLFLLLAHRTFPWWFSTQRNPFHPLSFLR
ncbi:MAG: putative pyruvate formate lyase activating enzyme [Moorella sp. (in: firmicutes)]|nr:putative pyruvate formate lyase activating enzyme [Moorella sp. (in: firmicutes)]